MIWFTSDYHFSHNNTSKIRGFSNIEDHDNTIIDNLLSKVSKGDIVYFLGDLGLKKSSIPAIMKLFDALRDKSVSFQWIHGNHDHDIFDIEHKVLTWKGTIKEIHYEDQYITLFHYPMYVWNRSHYGAWALYGHIHNGDSTFNRLTSSEDGLIVAASMTKSCIWNVNVDLNNYMPYSFSDLKEIFKDSTNWDRIIKNSLQS